MTAAGPLNPKEVADMRATTELPQPVADDTRPAAPIGWKTASRKCGASHRATPPAAQNWIGLPSSAIIGAGKAAAAVSGAAAAVIIGARCFTLASMATGGRGVKQALRQIRCNASKAAAHASICPNRSSRSLFWKGLMRERAGRSRRLRSLCVLPPVSLHSLPLRGKSPK